MAASLVTCSIARVVYIYIWLVLSELWVAASVLPEFGDPVLLSAPLRGGVDPTLSISEKALLRSKGFEDITEGIQAMPQVGHDTLGLIKERMLARLNNVTLVETEIVWRTQEGQDIKEAAVVGSWGGWLTLHHLEEQAPGYWSTSLNIPVGKHVFKFVIDGEWRNSGSYDIVEDSVGTGGNNLLKVSRSLPTLHGSKNNHTVVLGYRSMRCPWSRRQQRR
jgi:hypothetical protein